MKNRYLIYFVIAGLLLGSFFGALIHNVVGADITIKDVSLLDYKEVADINEKHVLNIGFDSNKFVLSNSDISYKLVGNTTDIKIFKDCVSVEYSVKNGVIYFIGTVKKFGVYHVDIQPIIQGLTIEKFSWWNSSWQYYKVCNILNKVSGSQIKLTVGNNTLGGGGNVSLGGHVKQGNYFKDVRFVNSANTTEYYFWLENQTVNTQYTLWVNNSDNASKILMYYGNSICQNSTYRNGSKTFLFFDNFTASTVNLNKWTGNTADVTISNGIAIHYKSGTTGDSYFYSKFVTNESLFFRSLNKGVAPLVHTSRYGLFTPTFSQYEFREFEGAGNLFYTLGSGGYATVTTDYTKDYFRVIQFNLIKGKSIDWFQNGSRRLGSPYTTGTKVCNANINAGSYITHTSYNYIDWILIGKYSSQKWGAFSNEITNSPPTLNLIYPINNSINIPLMPIVNIWCNDTDTVLLNIMFQTNYTGVWVTHQLNNSFTANNICRWNFSEAIQSIKKYYFRVYVYDLVTNISKWYCFTTISTAPYFIGIYDLYPLDDSINICPCCDTIAFKVSSNISNVNITLYGKEIQNPYWSMWNKYINVTDGNYVTCLGEVITYIRPCVVGKSTTVTPIVLPDVWQDVTYDVAELIGIAGLDLDETTGELIVPSQGFYTVFYEASFTTVDANPSDDIVAIRLLRNDIPVEGAYRESVFATKQDLIHLTGYIHDLWNLNDVLKFQWTCSDADISLDSVQEYSTDTINFYAYINKLDNPTFLFNKTYQWYVNVTSVDGTVYNQTDVMEFNTSNDINCSNSTINAYTKIESDSLFLGALINIDNGLLFLLICLSIWIFLVSKYLESKEKELILALTSFMVSFPLAIILGTFAYNYPFGFVLVTFIPILSLVIVIDSIMKDKKRRVKK